MTFDNGATDAKSDSHTVILSCVERFEESVGSVRAETDSRILHGQAHMIVFVSFGLDQQQPWMMDDGAHRV